MILSTLKISVLYQWNSFLQILIFDNFWPKSRLHGLKQATWTQKSETQKLHGLYQLLYSNAIHHPYYSRLVPGGTKDLNLGEPHFFLAGAQPMAHPAESVEILITRPSPENKICGPNPPKPISQGIISKISYRGSGPLILSWTTCQRDSILWYIIIKIQTYGWSKLSKLFPTLLMGWTTGLNSACRNRSRPPRRFRSGQLSELSADSPSNQGGSTTRIQNLIEATKMTSLTVAWHGANWKHRI